MVMLLKDHWSTPTPKIRNITEHLIKPYWSVTTTCPSCSLNALPPNSLPTLTFLPESVVAIPAKLTNPLNVPRRHLP